MLLPNMFLKIFNPGVSSDASSKRAEEWSVFWSCMNLDVMVPQAMSSWEAFATTIDITFITNKALYNFRLSGAIPRHHTISAGCRCFLHDVRFKHAMFCSDRRM